MGELTKRDIGFYLFEDIYKLDEEKGSGIGVNFQSVNYSFKDVERSVDYFCHLLTEKGVKKGDHVALLSMNSYNWLIAFYAIVKIGAVAVLINYMARHQTLVELIKYTDCKFICHGKYSAGAKDANELDELLKETNISKEHAISINNSDINFKDILIKEDIVPFTSPYSREEDSKRTSYIIFTTGTTSKPKAAMLSQYSLMNIIYINFARLDPIFPQRFMCLLPMFHCFGLLVVNAYMAFQRTVYLNALDDKVQIYKDFVKNKCGDYASVSIIFDKLARAPFWWLHGGRFVKHCIVGGGFTSEQELKFLEKKYGKGKFMNGYGQTECSPMISLVYPDAPAIKQKSTVGTPMEGIELAFMNPETKELLPQGQKGEILVKGYNVFNGYYKMEKDKQPFDKDGYLHTGDLGYLDEDGYLVLSGRLKDIIIRKGENISPQEIEKELRKFKEFGNVRVLGFPSVDEGEFIIACVELKKKPPHFVEEKYFDEMHKTLPAVKIPSHIIYMKRFPLTANGKLDEVKLREICMVKLGLFLNEKLLAMKTKKLMATKSSK
jgi:fatty-acyl-CoA synthase